METIHLGILQKFKLKLWGQKYYLTKLLPSLIYTRYGTEKTYSEQQMTTTAKILGYAKYFDLKKAKALLGDSKQFGNEEEYFKIRAKYGLVLDGPSEVLWVYCGIEKFNPDPLGRDRAADTASSGDGIHAT